MSLSACLALSAAQRDPELGEPEDLALQPHDGVALCEGHHGGSRITGTPAMPKGLRHGFGVKAFQSNVPPHLVQRWLGHASLRTTAIYGDVIGPEERAFAARMWSISKFV